ncbi:pilus assembly protein PilR [Salmonella enterica subsp. enterica serovar Montevideo]|nr:pilus assembly protein PilR [Salmonella enterica subsp. enterica serovar Montevideo]
MREMNFGQRLRRFIVRKTFTAPYRVQFYEALRFLLENKQPLKSALEQMRDAWTGFGRHWHPFAELATDCIESLRENTEQNSLEYTLSLWVPQEEAAVISAGIRSGSIVDALKFATTLTDARKQIHKAIWQMAIYPAALLIMMGGTLYVLNTELIPVLSKISPPDSWSGALGFLYGLSGFIDNYGVICAILFVVFVVLISWSLANWSRPDSIRSFADNLMPWSIYQDIQGATFLLNMAALLQAKMTTLNSLTTLQEFASPWLSVRLDSIIYRVRLGEHLGLALRQCGYQFPSREAANFLSLLQGDGATDLISNYGQRWLVQTLERVKKRAVIVRLIMLVFLVMSLLLLVLAIMDIQSIGDSSMGNI